VNAGGGKFRAVIFDMDGVLTDSEPAFFAAFNDVLASYGTQIDMDDYAQFIGTATSNTCAGIISLKQLSISAEEMADMLEPPLMARLREPRPALPGARELIDQLRTRRVPIALCTASYMRWVDAILEGAGLTGLFDTLSTADMVENTKPDPAPYLLAAHKLGVPPHECVAIEDSGSGVTSAMRAGTHVVQLRATETAARPIDGVSAVISSLAEIRLDMFEPRATLP
jgi:HAD superfamily hydrolase (TIGR01509 family)